MLQVLRNPEALRLERVQERVLGTLSKHWVTTRDFPHPIPGVGGEGLKAQIRLLYGLADGASDPSDLGALEFATSHRVRGFYEAHVPPSERRLLPPIPMIGSPRGALAPAGPPIQLTNWLFQRRSSWSPTVFDD